MWHKDDEDANENKPINTGSDQNDDDEGGHLPMSRQDVMFVFD